jgi:hypothetical protein
MRSAEWGNDRSRLPPARRSRRKTVTGKSCSLASLADAAGRLLKQDGHWDEALLLAQSDSLGQLISNGQRWAKQLLGRSRAARHVAEQGRGKTRWVTAPSDDVRSSAKEWPTHVGGDDRRPPASSALRAVSAATRNRGGVLDRVIIPGGQMETGR